MKSNIDFIMAVYGIHLKTDGRIIGRYRVEQGFSSNGINSIWFADFTKVVTQFQYTVEEQIFS